MCWVQEEYATHTGLMGKSRIFPHNESSGSQAVPRSVWSLNNRIRDLSPTQLSTLPPLNHWLSSLAFLLGVARSPLELQATIAWLCRKRDISFWFCFFVFFFRSTPMAHGSSQARDRIRATAAGYGHSHARSELYP